MALHKSVYYYYYYYYYNVKFKVTLHKQVRYRGILQY